MKKLSVRDNNVPGVLLLNTIFGTLLMSPVIIGGLMHGNYGLGNTVTGHLLIGLKAVIVLSSWILGYFAIKHLPLTIQGPINATRPVMVLVGALIIFGERLNLLQWAGILLGFASLFFISRIGSKEGFSLRSSKWLWMSIGATTLGAISALYDKYLLGFYKPLEVQAWYSLYQACRDGLTRFRPRTFAHLGFYTFTMALVDTRNQYIPHCGRPCIFLLFVDARFYDFGSFDDTPWQCACIICLRCDSAPRTACTREANRLGRVTSQPRTSCCRFVRAFDS